MKSKHLDVAKEIFKVKTLMNDDKLIIQKRLLKSLKTDLLNFNLDETNHRIYSLLMGTSNFKYKKKYENLMTATIYYKNNMRFQRKGWKTLSF
jgi:hypothetical protein